MVGMEAANKKSRRHRLALRLCPPKLLCEIDERPSFLGLYPLSPMAEPHHSRQVKKERAAGALPEFPCQHGSALPVPQSALSCCSWKRGWAGPERLAQSPGASWPRG